MQRIVANASDALCIHYYSTLRKEMADDNILFVKSCQVEIMEVS